MNVAIIGLGVIGRAQARLFAAHHQVHYDPMVNRDYPHVAIAACDFAVVCVGTPAKPDGSADLSMVFEAVATLPASVPVLLRSTVTPGTTDLLAETWRVERICHWPEFMGENPAHPWQQSSDVPYAILGGTAEARAFFAPRLQVVHPGPWTHVSAREAELAKYAANLYWATRVTFVNELAGICAAFGADYGQVRTAWLQDPRMTGAYTEFGEHPPGFGGRCWPKDLTALIHATKRAGHRSRFLEAVHAANARFTR